MAIMGTSATRSEVHVYVTTANPLPRLLQIVAVGMELENKELKLTWIPPTIESPLPCKLSEADEASYYTPPRKIALASRSRLGREIAGERLC